MAPRPAIKETYQTITMTCLASNLLATGPAEKASDGSPGAAKPQTEWRVTDKCRWRVTLDSSDLGRRTTRGSHRRPAQGLRRRCLWSSETISDNLQVPSTSE